MPKSKATKKKRLCVPLTDEQRAQLEQLASQNDVSIARVMLEAIKEFLRKHKDRSLPLFKRHPPKL
jgi:predicted transcriptional regulator